MKSYLDLIPISAKVHKKQSRITRTCIVLAVLLVTAVFGMADMEMRSQKLQEIKQGGNWHVLFSDIGEQTAAKIAARPEVETSGWYAYLGEDDGYTIGGKAVGGAGFDANVAEEMFSTKMTRGVYPSKKDQIALTANAESTLGVGVGDTVSLEHPGESPRKLTVSGIFEGTSKMLKQDVCGMLMTTEGFRAAVPRERYKNQYIVRLSQYCNMQKVIADMAKQNGLSGKQVLQNGNLLAVLGQSDNSYVLGLYGTAAVLFVLVLLAGVLMLAGSLNSNVMQRTEFFGMMRCLGATKKQVMRFVRREGLQWCKTAIPLGLGIGTVLIWALCAVLKILSPGYFAEMPTFAVSWVGILSGVAVGISTVLLAVRAPAKRAARVSPLAAVSGNSGSVRPVRTAARTAVFPIETALGVHHAVSAKKNFILMVGSFSLSIVLFLCFSAAVDFMHHAVRPLKPWTPDLSIVSRDDSRSVPDSLLKTLKERAQVKRVYGRMFAYDISARVNGRDRKINLISYEDQQFAWAKDSLLEGSVEEVRQKDDRVLAVYGSGSSLRVGDTISLGLADGQKEVSVAGELSNVPFDEKKGTETVICSEAAFRKLTGQTGYTVLDIQLSGGAGENDVEEIRTLAGSGLKFSDQRASNREAKGAFYAMALFLYGFLVVIALITVFNIVNSVAMSVSARVKQYGAMRAIGMSGRQLVKMVAAEAVTYSVAGSAAGCALGLPLHKLLFEKMVTAHWGDPWRLPFGMLAVIVAIVIVTSLLAVHAPSKRIRSMSIVDTINAQ